MGPFWYKVMSTLNVFDKLQTCEEINFLNSLVDVLHFDAYVVGKMKLGFVFSEATRFGLKRN